MIFSQIRTCTKFALLNVRLSALNLMDDAASTATATATGRILYYYFIASLEILTLYSEVCRKVPPPGGIIFG